MGLFGAAATRDQTPSDGHPTGVGLPTFDPKWVCSARALDVQRPPRRGGALEAPRSACASFCPFRSSTFRCRLFPATPPKKLDIGISSYGIPAESHRTSGSISAY